MKREFKQAWQCLSSEGWLSSSESSPGQLGAATSSHGWHLPGMASSIPALPALQQNISEFTQKLGFYEPKPTAGCNTCPTCCQHTDRSSSAQHTNNKHENSLDKEARPGLSPSQGQRGHPKPRICRTWSTVLQQRSLLTTDVSRDSDTYNTTLKFNFIQCHLTIKNSGYVD